MADVVHARDGLPAGTTASPRATAKSDARTGARKEQPPRTDVGTLVLHWTTAVAFIVSLFTGIRIAAAQKG